MYLNRLNKLGRVPFSDDRTTFNPTTSPIVKPEPIAEPTIALNLTHKEIVSELIKKWNSFFTTMPALTKKQKYSLITDEDILILTSEDEANSGLEFELYDEAIRRGLIDEREYEAPLVELRKRNWDTETEMTRIFSDTGNYAQDMNSTPNFIEAAAATDNQLLKYGILGVGFYILYDTFIASAKK